MEKPGCCARRFLVAAAGLLLAGASAAYADHNHIDTVYPEDAAQIELGMTAWVGAEAQPPVLPVGAENVRWRLKAKFRRTWPSPQSEWTVIPPHIEEFPTTNPGRLQAIKNQIWSLANSSYMGRAELHWQYVEQDPEEGPWTQLVDGHDWDRTWNWSVGGP